MKKFLFVLLILVNSIVNGQDKLPEWFLNPPVSPDNSCVYLIGISDPGMNRADATTMAVTRAKAFLNYFLLRTEPDFRSSRTDGTVFEVVAKSVVSQKYHNENFETLQTFVTNYNELIVLLKYSFIQRQNTSASDSVLIKTMMTYYESDNGKNTEANLEWICKTNGKLEKSNIYYAVNQKNNKDSLTSYFETATKAFEPVVNGFSNVYRDQQMSEISPVVQQTFQENFTAGYSLSNGLWPAYLMCFQEILGQTDARYYETLKNPGKAYAGSLKVMKGMSVKNNVLELNTGMTLFSEGFLTLSYPEDVDTNIPACTQKKTNCFALIIGNEDYSSFQQGLSSEVNVDFAQNDAATFYQYLTKTLGVPAGNVVLLINARALEMHKAIDKLALLAKSMNGKAELVFYYAGHGFPDDQKEAYLIPVDVSGTDLQFGIKLKELYAKLTEFPTQKVSVFLDACFSGGARNQGLVAARGVKIKPKADDLAGNLVVLAASGGEQSSLPYKEKKHGMFTYWLLKKLQETKGDISYGELFAFLQEQVGVKSLLINSREQTPQANVSPSLGEEWKNWKMK